jgi:hypothetical protein
MVKPFTDKLEIYVFGRSGKYSVLRTITIESVINTIDSPDNKRGRGNGPMRHKWASIPIKATGNGVVDLFPILIRNRCRTNGYVLLGKGDLNILFLKALIYFRM